MLPYDCFDYEKINELLFDQSIVRLVARLYVLKERVEAYCDDHSGCYSVKEKLYPIAVEQSAEAACKISRSSVSAGRLRLLAAGSSQPKNANEERIAGYVRAKGVVNLDFDPSATWFTREFITEINDEIEPTTAGTSFEDDASARKNQCVVWTRDGRPYEVVSPLPHSCSSEALLALGSNIAQAETTFGGGEYSIEPSLLVPIVFADLLYIHPFVDGNLRTALAIASMLYQRYGFDACAYISMEKYIEMSQDAFVAALSKSYYAANAGANTFTERASSYGHIIKFFLNVLIQVYSEYFSVLRRMNEPAPGGVVNEAKKAISSFEGPFTKADLERKMLNYGKTSIGNALHVLVDSGYLLRYGTGKATSYIKA